MANSKSKSVTFENIKKIFRDPQSGQDVAAVAGVSFRLEPGELVTLLGPSGCGKSTILRMLSGFEQPTSGKIFINGKNLANVGPKQIPRYRRKLGVVFQDFRLLKDRNVYENVAFAQRVIEANARSIRQRVPMMLSLVGLAAKYKSYPKQLSGGEQQRVAIARALVNEPKILLADEPTGNLDSGNAWEIMKLLDEINKKGTTVLVVTHNMAIVEAMKKRVISMKNGTIVSDNSLEVYRK